MIVRDRTGQVWLLGFEPYQYPTIVVATEEISPSLFTHLVVRLDNTDRSFELDESIHLAFERRDDMKRLA